ncbi:hypothetical protein SynA1560_02218 [Synechococcus sp. A15-60]|nr:hypothetical protein SynA1560_02218 [Synechococcus sp. A15-60]
MNVIRHWVETDSHRRIFDWSTHHKKPQNAGPERDLLVVM